MNIPPLRVFDDLWKTVASDGTVAVPALPESALSFFLARVPRPASGRPLVVALLERSHATLPSILRAATFWNLVPFDEQQQESPLQKTILPLLLPQERSGDIPTPRLHAYWECLMALREKRAHCILATPKELEQPAPRLSTDLGGSEIFEGQISSPVLLAELLLALGYSEEKGSTDPGTFFRKGGLVDIFPYHAREGVRVEFTSNTIERIRPLEKHNEQKNGIHAALSRAAETGPRRLLLYPLSLPHSLPVSFGKILENAYIIAEEGALPAGVRADLLFEPFEKHPTLLPVRTYSGNTVQLGKDVATALANGNSVSLFTARPEALKEDVPSHDRLQLLPLETAANAHGFRSTDEHVLFLTDADIGESAHEQPLTWESGMAYSRRFSLSDFVVHRDHGIARFRGIERKIFQDAEREYLILEYAAGDKLYVPVEVSYKVTAYIGAANPVVHRLGGSEWEMTTREVREETAQLAKELLQLYATREVQGGTAYPPESDAEKKLAAQFPYDMTPDQAAAIREVTKDMERAQPMDRLVCGDVGFGKTEVAIRAAFKAVHFGKQVVVLTPTTLLAQQHYDTFQERLHDFPTRVALLSRFQTPQEQEMIIEKLKAGNVDIVIGTHRLLSDDIQFAALGLLIIDEEQKFGVEQKERVRQIRANVDVLSLSATPIPRTLHMALSGLRSLSVIATPPGGRRPVVTKVMRENDLLIKKSLETEIERGGQAYVLWNTVETIEAAAERIRKLLPDARVVVGHGQMAEKELMHVMELFDTKKADILVSSTIIQNGIDLPNVNTLIVFDAPSFGLSDLYQLRGRVGRGNKQAYAYFLYRQGRLPFEARKRLSALLEAVELGSGWTLALRDLEIRGAGNLLGKEQHGTIKAIGVHLFGELLAEEVDRLRSGKARDIAADVQTDLPLRAYLPETYIPNMDERLSAYTRLGAARTENDLTAARESLEKTYGHLPEEAETFFHLLATKFLASRAGVAALVAGDSLGNLRDAMGKKERRITLTLSEGLTPALAYAAIADNPRWTFTGSSMSIPLTALGMHLLDGIDHTLRVLLDARKKEQLTGTKRRA